LLLIFPRRFWSDLAGLVCFAAVVVAQKPRAAGHRSHRARIARALTG
jgi:hypothetical protein